MQSGRAAWANPARVAGRNRHLLPTLAASLLARNAETPTIALFLAYLLAGVWQPICLLEDVRILPTKSLPSSEQTRSLPECAGQDAPTFENSMQQLLASALSEASDSSPNATGIPPNRGADPTHTAQAPEKRDRKQNTAIAADTGTGAMTLMPMVLGVPQSWNVPESMGPGATQDALAQAVTRSVASGVDLSSAAQQGLVMTSSLDANRAVVLECAGTGRPATSTFPGMDAAESDQLDGTAAPLLQQPSAEAETDRPSPDTPSTSSAAVALQPVLEATSPAKGDVAAKPAGVRPNGHAKLQNKQQSGDASTTTRSSGSFPDASDISSDAPEGIRTHAVEATRANAEVSAEWGSTFLAASAVGTSTSQVIPTPASALLVADNETGTTPSAGVTAVLAPLQGRMKTLESQGSEQAVHGVSPATAAVTALPSALSAEIGGKLEAVGVGAPQAKPSAGNDGGQPASGPHTSLAESLAAGSSAAGLHLHALQRSEMQVSINAEEFGRVSVHASYGREGIAARISLENTVLGSALGSALSTHMPAVEQRIAAQQGTRTSMSVSTGMQSDSGNGGGNGGRPAPNGTVSSSRRGLLRVGEPSAAYAGVTSPGSADLVAPSGTGYARRLDIHI